MNVLIDHKETTYTVRGRQNLNTVLSFQIICSILNFRGQTNTDIYIGMCACVNIFFSPRYLVLIAEVFEPLADVSTFQCKI